MSRPTFTSFAMRIRERRRANDGVSTIGLLSVILILGVLVAIPLSLNVGSSSSSTTSPPGATTTTAPRTIAAGANEAAIAACRADFATILQAVDTYRALNGSNPLRGTSWATATTNGGPILQSWPDASSSWSFAWNGATLTVVPAHGRASHGSYGTPAAKSGCYASTST